MEVIDGALVAIAVVCVLVLLILPIEMCPDEMAVLDSILFRMWQMGWLPEQSEPTARQSTREMKIMKTRRS